MTFYAASAFLWFALALVAGYANDTAPRNGLQRSGLWLVIGVAMAIWSASHAARVW